MVARVQYMLFFLLVIVLFGVGSFLMTQADDKPYRGQAMAELPAFLPENSKDLGQLVLSNYHEYRANTMRWSFAYYTCIFGAAALSSCAALILKLDKLNKHPSFRNDLAAISATLAALLITLSTVGDFQQKWQANRMAASSMENLAYDLLKEGPAHERLQILSRIQEINRLRNLEITGQERFEHEEQRKPKGKEQQRKTLP